MFAVAIAGVRRALEVSFQRPAPHSLSAPSGDELAGRRCVIVQSRRDGRKAGLRTVTMWSRHLLILLRNARLAPVRHHHCEIAADPARVLARETF